MTTNNGVPLELPQPSKTPAIRFPKPRLPSDAQSMASSISSLPYRASNASVSSLFASTTTPSGSRSVSPNGNGTPRLQSSVFGGTPGEGAQLAPADKPEDPRTLILQGLVPHIAVHTSSDTHELVQDKGFSGGLWELLRPFGERVQGKVTIRDSVGAGRTWEDFAVRFVQLGDGQEQAESLPGSRRSADEKSQAANGKAIPEKVLAQRRRTGGDVSAVEGLVDRHLAHAEQYPSMEGEDYLTFNGGSTRNKESPSPFYTLYLRRLLSGIPMAPHETWSHPVACVIAISSRNSNPIESLRGLYEESSRGEKRLPLYVYGDYLRYYVLVHDEERDDITKSMTLFEQMKRHFGLHCHLLRLRSSHCVASDDDTVQFPRCQWVSAAEEIVDIQERETSEDIEATYPWIYESDTTAIKTFIREMVTQSVIPSMERQISKWNEEVASKRRGLSGRILNLSKKWTGFGGSSRPSSNASANASGSNYDAVQGLYRPDAPEAVMRKLADWAFMLRDWKLAHSTYDLLRSDFNNDKAWKYHAAANEMAAISALLMPQAISSKARAETVDLMLETASYSYITRCSATYGALRALSLGMELLRLRGSSAIDDAARWGSRLLEYKVVGAVGEALFKERVAACHASRKGAGTGKWGARARKSALWSVLAADAWLTLGKPQQAKIQLDDAEAKYKELLWADGLNRWENANPWIVGLRREVAMALYPESAVEPGEDLAEEEEMLGEEMDDAFESRPHRKSLMGLQTAPLSEPEVSPLEAQSRVEIQFE